MLRDFFYSDYSRSRAEKIPACLPSDLIDCEAIQKTNRQHAPEATAKSFSYVKQRHRKRSTNSAAKLSPMAAPAFDALINTANPNAAEEPNVAITALCITPKIPIAKRNPLTKLDNERTGERHVEKVACYSIQSCLVFLGPVATASEIVGTRTDTDPNPADPQVRRQP